MRLAVRHFALVALLALLAGCSTIVTSEKQKRPMMEQFIGGQAESALQLAQKKHDSTEGKGDELVWLLECGSLQFYLGDYKGALASFRRCEALIEEYDERALVSLQDTGNEALTVLSNDNALPYRGWCRDRVALGIYKSLAYLGLNNEQGFRAQVKRMRGEHQKILEDYQKFFEAEQARLEEAKSKNEEVAKKAYSKDYLNDPRNQAFLQDMAATEEVAHRGYGNFLNPASLFLSALSLLRDGEWDNARIEFSHLYQAMPANATVKQYYVTALRNSRRDIPAALKGVKPFDFPLDRDCVYVLFAHDLTASFEQRLIYFPLMFAWPVCVFHPAMLNSLTVEGGGHSCTAVPLADMDGILAQEFSRRMPARLTRTLISALIKEAGYIATMAALDRSDNGGSSKAVLKLSTAVAWKTYQAMFNTADTRGWFLLPKEICLAQLPMPSSRKLTLRGLPSENQIELPENCGSAIVYVNAMTPAKIQCQVFPLPNH
jgi:hypothetical protein